VIVLPDEVKMPAEQPDPLLALASSSTGGRVFRCVRIAIMKRIERHGLDFGVTTIARNWKL
jgi:hypothetical protein